MTGDLYYDLVITTCICATRIFVYLNSMTTYVAGNYYHQPNFTGKGTVALET